VYIYGSYRKIKTVLSLFGPPCTGACHEFPPSRSVLGTSIRGL